jgi:anti-sigma factor RsiW
VSGSHPDLALIGYLRGELDAEERGRVEAHLAECAACRATASDFQAILTRLAADAPPLPEPAWSRYCAEIRARLEASVPSPASQWLHPFPMAVTAAAATIAVVLALTLGERAMAPNGDVASLEDAAFAPRFDTVEFFEELDVIRNLDRLAGTREG